MVDCKRESSPIIFKYCFGFAVLLRGQKRVPEPPAIIRQYNFSMFDALFLLKVKNTAFIQKIKNEIIFSNQASTKYNQNVAFRGNPVRENLLKQRYVLTVSLA